MVFSIWIENIGFDFVISFSPLALWLFGRWTMNLWEPWNAWRLAWELLGAFGSFGCAICAMDALQNEFGVIYKYFEKYCSGTVATIKVTVVTVMCTVVTVMCIVATVKNLTVGVL